MTQLIRESGNAEQKVVDNRKVFAVEIGLRLIRAAAVAFWVTVIAFLMMRLAPGDPARNSLGIEATQQEVEILQKQLGLDRPLLEQFVNFFSGLLRGDFGTSLTYNREVSDIIFTALPTSLWLVLLNSIIVWVIVIPLALFVATSKSVIVAYVFRSSTAISIALPNFFVALLLILVFSIKYNWAPLLGYTPDFPGNLRYLWLPAVVMAISGSIAIMSRILASSISDTLREEYVETGIFRGISRPRFLFYYLLKPSLAPTVALAAYGLGTAIGTTAIIESIFAIPGIGTELLTAVFSRDYPTVQALAFIFGLIVVFISFVGDLLAYWLDRRVKL